MKNKKNLYDVLGVDKTASASEIKKAYRGKAKKAHTDKGGDHEEMTEINNACAVLKLPSKREHYDRTGETQDTPFDKKFHAFIQEVFVTVVVNGTGDIESEDLIKSFKQKIEEFILHNDHGRQASLKEIKKFEKVVSRMKSTKVNMINNVLQGNIDQHKQSIAHLDDMDKFLKEAFDHLKDYNYEFTEKPKARLNGPTQEVEECL